MAEDIAGRSPSSRREHDYIKVMTDCLRMLQVVDHLCSLDLTSDMIRREINRHCQLQRYKFSCQSVLYGIEPEDNDMKKLSLSLHKGEEEQVRDVMSSYNIDTDSGYRYLRHASRNKKLSVTHTRMLIVILCTVNKLAQRMNAETTVRMEREDSDLIHHPCCVYGM